MRVDCRPNSGSNIINRLHRQIANPIRSVTSIEKPPQLNSIRSPSRLLYGSGVARCGSIRAKLSNRATGQGNTNRATGQGNRASTYRAGGRQGNRQGRATGQGNRATGQGNTKLYEYLEFREVSLLGHACTRPFQTFPPWRVPPTVL